MKIKDAVRAKHPSGAEFTTSKQYAKLKKLQVIDKPAVDRNGNPLPPKSAPLKNDQAGENTPAIDKKGEKK